MMSAVDDAALVLLIPWVIEASAVKSRRPI
jgi:hypothetical protein